MLIERLHFVGCVTWLLTGTNLAMREAFTLKACFPMVTVEPTRCAWAVGTCMGRGNMHATWDNLLGGSASAGDVRRRVTDLQADYEIATMIEVEIERADTFNDWLSPSKCLAESREHARQPVYTSEVLEAITAAMRGLVDRVELPKLSEGYYLNAGNLAKVRAFEAGYRLSSVVRKGLSQ